MRHTIGQHAQILGTTEHLCLTDGSLETMDGILAPEEVMALVEEVVVEPHIGILLLGSQRLIDGFLPGADTRMVHLRLSGILHKQHIADEPVESITDPEAVLIVSPLETGLYLPLGVVFRTEVIESVGTRHEEVVTHILGMDTKEAFQHAVVDERPRKEVTTERQTEVFYLVHRKRQGR